MNSYEDVEGAGYGSRSHRPPPPRRVPDAEEPVEIAGAVPRRAPGAEEAGVMAGAAVPRQVADADEVGESAGPVSRRAPDAEEAGVMAGVVPREVADVQEVGESAGPVPRRAPDAEEPAQRAGRDVWPTARLNSGTEPPGAPPAGATAGDPPSAGIAGLSLPYQAAAGVALVLIAAVACVHLAMIFLHVAPSNTVTKQHGEAVDAWVYPEFEQNWKLFAPNPLQQNIAVQVRAEYTAATGHRRTSDWIDLSAQDGAEIRGNLLPSHIHQNQLRRAWDFYVGSHDTENRPNGMRGRLSESYVRRIVMLRLDGHDLGGPVERIQLRSSTTNIDAPGWSDEKTDLRPVHRELPWWTVTEADLPGDAGNDRTGGERAGAVVGKREADGGAGRTGAGR